MMAGGMLWRGVEGKPHIVFTGGAGQVIQLSPWQGSAKSRGEVMTTGALLASAASGGAKLAPELDHGHR